MFIYSKNFDLSLAQYGIEVPLLDTRVIGFLDYLKVKCPSKLKSPSMNLSITEEILGLCHDDQYIDILYANPEQAIIDTFELQDSEGNYHRFNPADAQRELTLLRMPIFNQVVGTIEALKTALDTGFAYNLGGGLHHAMSFAGRGFCLVNDIVLAARFAQKNWGLQNIWIVDVDAHKGDGTAELTLNDESIINLSIHMKNGWPLDLVQYDEAGKLNPWFLPSTLDIEVASGEEHLYVGKLAAGLNKLKATYIKPDAVIVVQGSDPYEKDALASSSLLNLNLNQMKKRDLLVYKFFKDWGVPQTYVMSGGYGEYAHEVYVQFIDLIHQEL